MSSKLLIITGAAAWLGGIATAIAALSCDVETCESDPQPSAIVRLWAMQGSARVPIQGDSVRFQVHPTGGDPATDLATAPALQTGRCLDATCSQWALGSDQAGRVQIWAEACEKDYTAEVTVELDALACHAQTQYVDIQVDDTRCPVGPERLPPWDCDKSKHPSVHVLVAKRMDDYYQPVDVDMVWFEHEGRTLEARCIQGDDGHCLAWIAGYELAGPITVSTEYCDTVVSQVVQVQPIPDSCHVETEYMILEVSTRGCLTAAGMEPAPPPPPRWPWDLTTVPDPAQAGFDGPTGLVAKDRRSDPDPWTATDLTARGGVDQAGPEDRPDTLTNKPRVMRPDGQAGDLTVEDRRSDPDPQPPTR